MNAGAELDAAVAKAMGWIEPNEVSPWILSTSPTNIPEMLAWLNERGCIITLAQQGNGAWHCGARVGIDSIGGIRGDTIQHALALLVVAVAARTEAKEGKP